MFLKFLVCFVPLVCYASIQKEDGGQGEGAQHSAEVGMFILFEGDDSVEDVYVRGAGQRNAVVVSGQHFLSLGDSVPQWYILPIRQKVDDIAWLDEDCFFVEDSIIYYAEDDYIVHPLLVSNLSIDMIKPTEYGIYFVQDNTVSLLKYDGSTAQMILSAPSKINDFVPVGLTTYLFAMDNKIMFVDDGEPYVVKTEDVTINSLAWHDSGSVFFATDNRVGVFNLNSGREFTIINGAGKHLALLYEDLFMIFKDNGCIVLTNIFTAL